MAEENYIDAGFTEDGDFMKSEGASLVKGKACGCKCGEHPIALEPGKIYIIKCDHYLTDDAMERLESSLYSVAERIGVKFVIFERSLSVVTTPMSDL